MNNKKEIELDKVIIDNITISKPTLEELYKIGKEWEESIKEIKEKENVVLQK